jgi:hypothetical protein
VENGQRDDITPIEEANGFQALLKTGKYTDIATIAAKVGKTESFVYRRIKLLDLESELQDALGEGRLSIGHAEKLMRLTPELRKRAVESGVVWRGSPLFDELGDEPRAADDLQPLSELEDFIRNRATFDPNARETRMFQPALGAVLGEVTGPDDVEAHEDATILSLSDDSQVRSKLGAKKGQAIPLPPSQWRQIKSAKDRCEFTRPGCVTHGGPARLLDVCTKKSCQKHWAAPKKAKRAEPTGETRDREPARDYRAEEAEREASRKAWQSAFTDRIAPALVIHLKGLKFSASLVRAVLTPYDLNDVLKTYKVTLTDATAPIVLALSKVNAWDRASLIRTTKAYKFDLVKADRIVKKSSAARVATQKKPETSASRSKPLAGRGKKGRAA